MKVISVALAIALVASPALAQPPSQPIHESAERAARGAAAEQDASHGRRPATTGRATKVRDTPLAIDRKPKLERPHAFPP